MERQVAGAGGWRAADGRVESPPGPAPGGPAGAGDDDAHPSAEVARAERHREHALALAHRFVRLGPFLILGLAVATMALLTPVFLTERNYTNLLTQASVACMFSLGMFLVILTAGIDLSMGAVVALAGVAGGLVAGRQDPGSLLVVVLVMLGVGCAVGFVNGFILVIGRVPHAFIVTLATLGVTQGVALLISGGSSVAGFPQPLLDLATKQVGFVPYLAILVALVAALAAVMTTRTVWGRWIYAIGGNPEAARRAGIPVRKVLISVYMMAGLAAALGAILTVAQTNTGTPVGNQLVALDAITAVVIGGASFFGGRGSVGNVLVGAFTLVVIENGLDLLGVSPFYQQVSIGVLILVAIELDVLRAHLETRLQVAASLADDLPAPAGGAR